MGISRQIWHSAMHGKASHSRDAVRKSKVKIPLWAMKTHWPKNTKADIRKLKDALDDLRQKI